MIAFIQNSIYYRWKIERTLFGVSPSILIQTIWVPEQQEYYNLYSAKWISKINENQ